MQKILLCLSLVALTSSSLTTPACGAQNQAEKASRPILTGKDSLAIMKQVGEFIKTTFAGERVHLFVLPRPSIQSQPLGQFVEESEHSLKLIKAAAKISGSSVGPVSADDLDCEPKKRAGVNVCRWNKFDRYFQIGRMTIRNDTARLSISNNRNGLDTKRAGHATGTIIVLREGKGWRFVQYSTTFFGRKP